MLGAQNGHESAGDLETAVQVATRALQSSTGRRRVPFLAAVVDHQVALRTAELRSALAATVARFPDR